MKLSTKLLYVVLLVGLILVGCDKSVEPNPEMNLGINAEPDLNNLMAAAWPGSSCSIGSR